MQLLDLVAGWHLDADVDGHSGSQPGQCPFSSHIEPIGLPNHGVPLLLNTRPLLYHWRRLLEVYQRAPAGISHEDLTRLNICDGDTLSLVVWRG